MSANFFQYRTISDQLMNDMVSRLERAESIVILAPPNAGQGLVPGKLGEKLSRDGYGPIIKLNFCLATDRESAKRTVEEAVRRAECSPSHGESILSPLDGIGDTAYLFLANPEGLPHGLDRIVLQELRALVSERKIVAIVTGEHDLSELVPGPSSEFNLNYARKSLRRRLFVGAA